mmetsp:Transcript_27440/g.60022  ORF Transcript_27440/g.60022 Transcript_27440/m.60022 type:complete len:276 (+) Transcript_27440:666-1493(+)
MCQCHTLIWHPEPAAGRRHACLPSSSSLPHPHSTTHWAPFTTSFSTSVRVMMLTGLFSVSTTYTRCSFWLTRASSNWTKVVPAVTLTAGRNLPLTATSNSSTLLSSRPNWVGGSSRISEADRLPISLPAASTTPTLLLWSTAMWWKAVRAGALFSMQNTAPEVRPSSSTVFDASAPSLSLCCHSRVTMSDWDTTWEGCQVEAPACSHTKMRWCTLPLTWNPLRMTDSRVVAVSPFIHMSATWTRLSTVLLEKYSPTVVRALSAASSCCREATSSA